MYSTVSAEMMVADAAWVATAWLHREHPEREDFSSEAILAKAADLGFTRPGVRVHINQHCVANRKPNPGRYRMLYETGAGRRRLFRSGDPYDAAREGSKVTPRPEELPTQFRDLLEWYKEWEMGKKEQPDPLMELWGQGRALWADEPADQYVERLRRDWQ